MGWAEGLNAGINLGNVIKQGMLQDALAEEAKKYKVTEGAYGPGLSENLQGVIAARDQALQGLGENATPEQIQQVHAQYTPQMAEISRRVGLTSPEYNVNGMGQNYATMQEAQAAANAQRTQGLADVYREHGQIDKASELEARAQQQQLTGLQLSKAQREEVTAQGNQNASAALAEMKASGQPITSQVIAQLAKEHKGDYNTLLTGELNQLGYDEKSAALEIKTLKRDLSKAAVGGIPALNKFLADKFDPDKTDNITPEIVQTKGGFAVMYGGKVLPEYGTHGSLNELVGTVHGQIDGDPLGTMKTLASIRASEASVRYHDAATGLTGLRANAFKDEQKNREDAARIQDEFAGLSVADQNGDKGKALIRKFNMINVKAGGQVSFGPQAPQARPGQTMTDLEKENLREYYKWANDDRNLRLSQAEKDKKASQMGVLQFVNPGTSKVQEGLGSNPYADTGTGKTEAAPPAQQGLTVSPPKQPAINSMNTRILGRAGNSGYNVELPDGTTQIMGLPELERLGYKFPTGSGLSRPWYSDLLPQ